MPYCEARRYYLTVRFAAVLLSALLAASTAGAAPADASAARELGLLPARACVAGDWGTPKYEWRLQLGVFDEETGATRREEALTAKGIASTHFIATWLVDGEREPFVVVTDATFATEASARKAERALQKRGVRALARRFARYG